MALLPGILANDDPTAVVFACLLLVILVLALAYGVFWLRRQYWGSDDGGIPSSGFTLADLRELHRSGRISQEEFDRAKAMIVAAHQRAAQRAAGPPKPTGHKFPPQGP